MPTEEDRAHVKCGKQKKNVQYINNNLYLAQKYARILAHRYHKISVLRAKFEDCKL